MFRTLSRSSRRRVGFVAIAFVALTLLAVVGNAAYRRYTLAERVAAGRVLFEHDWQPGDALAGGGDGLGPVFNEKSCVACHFQGGVGGGGPTSKNVMAFEALPTRDRPEVFLGVVHASATQPTLEESLEHVSNLFPIVPGGVTVESGCTIRQQDFNPVTLETINSPPLFGAGLIDKISAWSIHADAVKRGAEGISHDLDGDFSSIPVGRVRTPAIGKAGKFGWKGQFASLEEFVASACAMELGLTNPQKAQIEPGSFREDKKAAMDMTARQLDQLVSYVAALPRPIEVLPEDPDKRAAAMRGKTAFAEAGCADCHTPNLGGVEGVYSDFRLYDLEDRKNTSYTIVKLPAEPPSDHPKAGEWKTPPLWGVADSAPYFHDGASTTLTDAIRRHKGSAKISRAKYMKLPAADQQAILAFLGTLRAPR